MRIHIYYGGRGLIEDSNLYVLSKITEVLEELRVEVKRYNLYECKNEIAVLASGIKEADGVILAASVDWYNLWRKRSRAEPDEVLGVAWWFPLSGNYRLCGKPDRVRNQRKLR